MKNRFWLNLFLILIGVVIGTLIAHLTTGVNGLSWLAFGLDFGTNAPVTVDLGIMTLTFGIRLSISVATVICTAISLIVGKFLVRK